MWCHRGDGKGEEGRRVWWLTRWLDSQLLTQLAGWHIGCVPHALRVGCHQAQQLGIAARLRWIQR